MCNRDSTQVALIWWQPSARRFLSSAAPSIRPGCSQAHNPSLRPSMACAHDAILRRACHRRRRPCTPQAAPTINLFSNPKRSGHSSEPLDIELNVSPPWNLNHVGSIATAAHRAEVESRFLPLGARSVGAPIHYSPFKKETSTLISNLLDSQAQHSRWASIPTARDRLVLP